MGKSMTSDAKKQRKCHKMADVYLLYLDLPCP